MAGMEIATQLPLYLGRQFQERVGGSLGKGEQALRGAQRTFWHRE